MKNKIINQKTFLMIVVFLLFRGVVFAQVDKIVAVVNNEAITQSDIDNAFKIAVVQLAQRYSKEDLEVKKEEIKKNILNKLIEDRLIYQEALKKRIEVDKNDIEKKVNEIAGDFGSEEKLIKALKDQGLTLEDIKKNIKDEFLRYRLVDYEIRSRINVSPLEITNYYQAHSKDFFQNEARKVTAIFFKQDEYYRVKEMLYKRSNYPLLLETYKDRLEKWNVERGRLKPEIEDIIFKTRKGDFTNLTKTDNGFYLFKVDEIIYPHTMSLNEAKGYVYEILYNQKFNERIKVWLDGLKKKAYIQIK
ncbi:MAG: peptidylprolyl isomerase [Candidatus Omnitrophota bacterium]